MITVRFEGEGTKEVLKVAKREVKKRLKDSMVDAATGTVLPKVKAHAPSIVRNAMTVKGVAKGPKITTKGPRKFDRIAGLLNFGGYIVTPLAPVQKDGHQALSIGSGLWRARVKKPRHYTGKDFIGDAIYIAFPNFEEEVLKGVMNAFDGIPHTP